MAHVQRISPCLWFNSEAEEAAKFYVSIFPNSHIVQTTLYTKAGYEFHGKPEGSVLTVLFVLDGMEFTALNGGPQFKFDEAISLQVFCETQDEIDYYWERLLTGGGAESACGWLTDRFGLSWQVVPTCLREMLCDPNPERTHAVMKAIFQMTKFDIATLRQAHANP